MELFTKLSEIMGEGCTLAITIAKTKNGMTVSVLPGNSLVKDAAKNKIAPLNISGSASELDEGFVNAIIQPVATTSKLFVDMKSFEESQAAAKEASEMEKKTKEKAAVSKVQYDKWMELAEQNRKESKYKDALTCAKKALEVAGDVAGGQVKTDAFIKKVNDESAANLFGAEDKSDSKNIKIDIKKTSKASAEEDADEENEE